MPGELEMLQRVHRYLVAISDADGVPHAAGAFTVYVHRLTSAEWGTYALPTGELGAGWQNDLDAVDAIFRRERRRGRYEWVAELYPDLEAEVRRRGFTEVEVEPLLVLEDQGHLVDADVEIQRVLPGDPRLRDLLEITRQAFDETDETTDEAVNERRAMLRNDRKTMLAAIVDGDPVGAGVVTRAGGVAEITAIATTPEHRRRGIGSAITSTLARSALDAGCDLVYLTARDDAAARIYRRLGFTRIGTYMEAARPKR